MPGNLMIQSIDTDNRIAAKFSDKELPRYARHGELYVVDGVLFIFDAYDSSSGNGKWFPLTDEKEIHTYEQRVPSLTWNIPNTFYTDNLQIIVYDANDKYYPHPFVINFTDNTIQLNFDATTQGKAHIIVSKNRTGGTGGTKNEILKIEGLSPVIFDNLDMITYRSAEYTFTCTGKNNTYQAFKCLVIHNDMSAFVSTFGDVGAGLGVVSVSVVDNVMRLIFTPSISGGISIVYSKQTTRNITANLTPLPFDLIGGSGTETLTIDLQNTGATIDLNKQINNIENSIGAIK